MGTTCDWQKPRPVSVSYVQILLDWIGVIRLPFIKCCGCSCIYNHIHFTCEFICQVGIHTKVIVGDSARYSSELLLHKTLKCILTSTLCFEHLEQWRIDDLVIILYGRLEAKRWTKEGNTHSKKCIDLIRSNTTLQIDCAWWVLHYHSLDLVTQLDNKFQASELCRRCYEHSWDSGFTVKKQW